MKKFISCLMLTFAAIHLFSPTMSIAEPQQDGNHTEYFIFGTEDLSYWTAGLTMIDRERKVDMTIAHRIKPSELSESKIMAYLGRDIFDGVILYGTIGQNTTKFVFYDINETRSEYGLGLHLNILDHEIPDPTLIEDKFRITGTVQYTKTSADYLRTDLEYYNFYSSLVLSLVNDVDGNKFFNVNSIAFYLGLVYSDINSSSISIDNTFGYKLGVSVFYTERVSFEVGIENIDTKGMLMGIHFRL